MEAAKKDAVTPPSPTSRRTIAAACAKAASFPSAILRSIGAIPQFVHGWMRAASTYFIAPRMTDATSSGLSIASVATSIAAGSTTLPSRRRKNSTGTLEWMHSSET